MSLGRGGKPKCSHFDFMFGLEAYAAAPMEG